MPDDATNLELTTDRRRGLLSGWRRVVPMLAPLLVGVLVLVAWEFAVWWWDVSPYLLPRPTAIAQTMGEERAQLFAGWLVTCRTLLVALTVSVVGGVLLAVLFTSSRLVELSLFPYAVVLQVTPLLALAPLLMIWIEASWKVMLICATIVAFFPILANTVIGLRSTDRGLEDLFSLYGASRWQRVRLLMTPTALPYFLAGLRVSVNLSLVGAVVAEFVIGAAADPPGLASIVYSAQYRSNSSLTFAALAMISLTGITLYFATYLLSHWLLRGWHESSLPDGR